MDEDVLATDIAKHNGGTPEPTYDAMSPLNEKVAEDPFDDVSSEVSSVASLPDELKQRYLEFDFSDEEDDDEHDDV